jgi:biotin operon repressor
MEFAVAERLEREESIDPRSLDLAVAQLKGIRVKAFGRRGRETESARQRLRDYFVENVGQDLPGEELAEVAGISEWARRVRELRTEGLQISQPVVGRYRLDALPS